MDPLDEYFAPEPQPVQGKGGRAITDDPRHAAWIERYAASNFLTAGCLGGCQAMQKDFPGLKLVRGRVMLSDGQGANHWWLETDGGEIADPTAGQFTDPEGCYRAEAVAQYIPVDESQSETFPTGKCPNCGGYCYGGSYFCCDSCCTSYANYINNLGRSIHWE